MDCSLSSCVLWVCVSDRCSACVCVCVCVCVPSSLLSVSSLVPSRCLSVLCGDTRGTLGDVVLTPGTGALPHSVTSRSWNLLQLMADHNFTSDSIVPAPNVSDLFAVTPESGPGSSGVMQSIGNQMSRFSHAH